MKILVAMDEFNGIISSYQANRYVEEAIASQIDHADIVIMNIHFIFCT
jgi:glycerate kinase